MSARAAASVGLVAALCALAPAASAGAAIPWRPCGEQLDCARVPVPLDWDRPGGRTIRLAVIRHRASRSEGRIGSLFFNPGGPGESGVDAVRRLGAAADALVEGRFDVISWDIRGSGASAGVSCFPSSPARARFWAGRPIPTTAAERRSYLARTAAFARRCGARNGKRLLRHITTADTARDLERLRQLAGEPRLSFYGVSAGTLIGQTYAAMFPRRVRAMALDAVVDPVAYSQGTAAWLASSVGSVDATFDAFLALCQAAGPARCALAGDVPAEQRAETLLAALRRAPLAAPSAVPPGPLTLGELLTALRFAYLPSPASWPQLGADLQAAVDGDGSALATAARGAASEPFRRRFEPTQAIVCADSPAREDTAAWPRAVERLTRVSRIGGPALGWLVGAQCASWPVRRTDRYTGPWDAPTPNPILLVGTRLDPNTPLAGAQRAARLLGNAVLITHEGYGHVSTSDPSACVDRSVTRYLVDLVVPARGTVCRADKLPFDP